MITKVHLDMPSYKYVIQLDSPPQKSLLFSQHWGNGNFKKLPNLNVPRGYHSCLVITLAEEKDLVVVVAGGGSHKVETFSFKEESWEMAQDFCDVSTGQCFQFVGGQESRSTVSTPTTTLFFGGQGLANDGHYSRLIFELSCPTGLSWVFSIK